MSTNHTKIINEYIEKNTIAEQKRPKTKKKKKPEISKKDLEALNNIDFSQLAIKLHNELEKTLPGEEGDILTARKTGFELKVDQDGVVARLTKAQRIYFVKLFDAYNKNYKEMDLLKKLLDARQKPDIRYGIRAIIESLTYRGRIALFPIGMRQPYGTAKTLGMILGQASAYVGAVIAIALAAPASAPIVAVLGTTGSIFGRTYKFLEKIEGDKYKIPYGTDGALKGRPKGFYNLDFDRYSGAMNTDDKDQIGGYHMARVINNYISESSAFVYIKTAQDREKINSLFSKIDNLNNKTDSRLDKIDLEYKESGNDKRRKILLKKTYEKHFSRYIKILKEFAKENKDNILQIKDGMRDFVQSHLRTPITKKRLSMSQALFEKGLEEERSAGSTSTGRPTRSGGSTSTNGPTDTVPAPDSKSGIRSTDSQDKPKKTWKDKKEYLKYRRIQDSLFKKITGKLKSAKKRNSITIADVVGLLINIEGELDFRVNEEIARKRMDERDDGPIKMGDVVINQSLLGTEDEERYLNFKTIIESLQRFLVQKGIMPATNSKGKSTIDGFFGEETYKAFQTLGYLNSLKPGKGISAADWTKGTVLERVTNKKLEYNMKMYKSFSNPSGKSFGDDKAGAARSEMGLLSGDLSAFSNVQQFIQNNRETITPASNPEFYDENGRVKDDQKSALEQAENDAVVAAIKREITNNTDNEAKQEQFNNLLKTVQDPGRYEIEMPELPKAPAKNSSEEFKRLFGQLLSGNHDSTVLAIIKNLMPDISSIGVDEIVTDKLIFSIFNKYLDYQAKEGGGLKHPLESRYQSFESSKDQKSATADSVKEFLSRKEELDLFADYLNKFFNSEDVLSILPSRYDLMARLQLSSKVDDENPNYFRSEKLDELADTDGVNTDSLKIAQDAFNVFVQNAPGKDRSEKSVKNFGDLRTFAFRRFVRYLIFNRYLPKEFKIPELAVFLEKAKEVFLKLDADLLRKTLINKDINLESLPLSQWIARLVAKGALIPDPKMKPRGGYRWAPSLQSPKARKAAGIRPPSDKMSESLLSFGPSRFVLEQINTIIRNIRVNNKGEVLLVSENITNNSHFLDYFHQNKHPFEDIVEIFSVKRIIFEEIKNIIDFSDSKRLFEAFHPDKNEIFSHFSTISAKNKLTFIKENSNILSLNIYDKLMDTALEKINNFLLEREV